MEVYTKMAAYPQNYFLGLHFWRHPYFFAERNIKIFKIGFCLPFS